MSGSSQRKSEAQAKVAADFLRLDPVFADWFLSYWKTFVHSVDYRSGIYLTLDEERAAGPINYVAYAALALTNLGKRSTDCTSRVKARHRSSTR
ncbi:Terpenoid synthase [Penicillium argentinense]|uniref:Terpenoid synthase n=1 Tax=Penicillium argentinense TaxID=1131581 RepID=A0A9W9JUY9_9EURO|nr:Terpenoid synthase [Penicillium argentinense]KAJ5082097.1 Terpenoid synthase [Penicillium argentinense]